MRIEADFHKQDAAGHVLAAPPCMLAIGDRVELIEPVNREAAQATVVAYESGGAVAAFEVHWHTARRLLLEHEVHPYVENPVSELRERCVCGHFRQHHLHVGVSSAVCCCMGCIRSRDPDDPYGELADLVRGED
ncbi:hypothetical protein [Actinomadura sp. CNU-125]|uniref:hypothetical protein n=1 Tax=Actinomadura sp. CNU-125 TaxID=1904961 RepID=UPI0011775824|nr:hypothetical protein [Actinomadura sp. CNU-125]